MAFLSIVDLVGSGGQSNFTFTSPYIAREHIHVYIDLVETTEFTFTSDFVIALDTPLVVAATVRIRRITPSVEALVDFSNGSVLGETDLDLATLQVLYVMQETADFQILDSIRAVRAPAIEVAGILELPLVADRKNSFLYFDALGNPTVSAFTGDTLAFTPTTEVFNGTGAQTAFTLVGPPGAASALIIAISGVVQQPDADFTVSSTTITFSTAPPSGTGNIVVQTFGIAREVSTVSGGGVVDGGAISVTTLGGVPRTLGIRAGEVFNVQDFGAVGNGVTDDTTAIQAAVNAAEALGGTVFFPTPAKYAITAEILVDSIYPVHLLSHMTGNGGGSVTTSYIKPIGNITGSLIKYSHAASRSNAGGGSIQGLSFNDPTWSVATLPGTFAVSGYAIDCVDFSASKIKDISIQHILGGGIHIDRSIMSNYSDMQIRYNGAASRPALHLEHSAAGTPCQSSNFTDLKLEVHNNAPYLKISSAAEVNKFYGIGFETDSTATPTSAQNFIYMEGVRNAFTNCHFNRNDAISVDLRAGSARSSFVNCHFNSTNAGSETITVNSSYNSWVGCTFANSKTGHEFNITQTVNLITGCSFSFSGGINCTSSRLVVSGCTFQSLTATSAYWITVGDTCVITGNQLDGDVSGTNGGISAGASLVVGNLVRDFVGIGILCTSSGGVVVGNHVSGTTGLDLSVTSEGTIVQHNLLSDFSSSSGSNGEPPRLKYTTIPIGDVAYGSIGTDTTPVSGTHYVAEVYVERTKSITGVGYLTGSVGATDNVIVGLYNAKGVLLASSTLAGTLCAGGANVFQQVAFTAAAILPPARYWIVLQFNGTTTRFRTVALNTFLDIRTKSTAGVFGTIDALTLPTTFASNVGPVAYVY